jgi:hypothetical protein
MAKSKQSKPKSGLFCDTCQKRAFTLQSIQGANQMILTCEGCGRPYIMEDGELAISDPSGGPTGKRVVSWNWLRNNWQPL